MGAEEWSRGVIKTRGSPFSQRLTLNWAAVVRSPAEQKLFSSLERLSFAGHQDQNGCSMKLINHLQSMIL